MLSFSGEVFQLFGDEFGFGERSVAPDLFDEAVVGRKDFADEFGAVFGERNAPDTAVEWAGFALNESAFFEAVDEAGDVGAVGDEFTTEIDLSKAFGGSAEKVEDVELARTEIPLLKEKAAGVPDGFGGAEELKEGLVARTRFGFFLCHGNMLPDRLFICQQCVEALH